MKGLSECFSAPSADHRRRRPRGVVLPARWVSGVAAFLLLAVVPVDAQDIHEESPFEPFVTQWCVDCHRGSGAKGDLDLAEYTPEPSVASLSALLSIRDRLEAGDMPPAGRPRPPKDEVERMLRFAEKLIHTSVPKLELDPGRVTVRRLSRFAYERTIKDLLGVEFDAEAFFPADDLGYGFDVVGDVLTLSTLHLEKYEAAALDIAERSLMEVDDQGPKVRRFEAELGESSIGPDSVRSDSVNLYTNGTVSSTIALRRKGTYTCRVHAFADQAGPDPARLGLLVDGKTVREFDVRETSKAPGTFTAEVALDVGSHELAVAFLNDYWDPKHPDPAQRDRNLIVDWIEIVGPTDALKLPEAHRWMFALDPGRGAPHHRARPIVKETASRAWRRPAKDEEVSRLAKLVADEVKAGGTFTDGVKCALQAILISPHFVFNLEPGGVSGRAGSVQDVGPWALASRLSYFLWSSLPDGPLREAARKRSLVETSELRTQARRLLLDPRAESLATNFAAQWLELRNLTLASPDPELIPNFDDELRFAMRRETELLFWTVVREGRSVFDLLRADFTFLNQRLARHYGIRGIESAEFRRVQLADPRRGGVIAHAAIHTVTANPTRTSPVKRGKWILENLLGAPPRPPPPGADSLSGEERITGPTTLRERLELHRSKASCASCHARMDALGFALENYDLVGRWRDRDGGRLIDASGTLPDGHVLAGPLELREFLGTQRAFLRCFSEKLFVYALGRAPSPSDLLALELMVAGLSDEPTVEDFVIGIVGLDAFRRRRQVP